MKTKLTSYFTFIILLLAMVPSDEKDIFLQVSNDKTAIELKAVNPDSGSILQVISKGASSRGANGINFGPDGNLYIASVIGREIIVMNPLNGEIINRLGPGQGVEGPDDLIFGPDGSLYWTEILFGNIGRMSPEGVVTKQFLAQGVNPISFSPEGRLFVGLCFLGDGLYELDPNLIDPPRPIIEATAENPYPLGFLNGFDIGPDGRLYGPLPGERVVVSVHLGQPGDLPSSSPKTDGTIQVVASDFEIPIAVKFDSQGRLYVADTGSGQVLQVNTSTGTKTLVANMEPGLDNLAFDSVDNLFVSNFENGSITRILRSGRGHTICPGGMVFPGGVALLERPDGKESVFVANTYTLNEFDGSTGEQINVFSGNQGISTTPFTVSADGDKLILSSWYSGAVKVWDPKTNKVLERYSVPAPLNAIRFQNDIVVADLGLGGVVWLSDNAMILKTDNTIIILPVGLTTDGETLWVADRATGTIWQIGFEGKTPSTPVSVACGLTNPEGLALDTDGNLLVVETGKQRLARVDLNTGEVSIIADRLELGLEGPKGLPPTYCFNGVAVSSSGAIYITGDMTNVLYRIWPR